MIFAFIFLLATSAVLVTGFSVLAGDALEAGKWWSAVWMWGAVVLFFSLGVWFGTRVSPICTTIAFWVSLFALIVGGVLWLSGNNTSE